MYLTPCLACIQCNVDYVLPDTVSHTYISQVNDIRNKLFHSADFKLSDFELEEYIRNMTTLLQDPKQLNTDPKAKRAVVQLDKVKAPYILFLDVLLLIVFKMPIMCNY